MRGDSLPRRAWPALVAAAAALLPTTAGGVILHPANDVPPEPGEPNGAPVICRPHKDVVGRWANNASAVAIGPDRIITTNHQGGGDLTPVFFGGVEYRVRAGSQTFIPGEDLRVAHVERPDGTPANLAHFVGVYDGSDELNQPFVVGGFGRGRGASLSENGTDYGYAWDFSADNTTQRWGINMIDDLDARTLVADFDAPGAPTAVDFEAALSEFDSGGGWFVLDGDTFKVAGLSAGVEHFGRSIFRANSSDPDVILDPNDPADTSGRDGPDLIYAVRLSPYAGQISAAMPEPGGFGLLLIVGGAALCRRGRHSACAAR